MSACMFACMLVMYVMYGDVVLICLYLWMHVRVHVPVHVPVPVLVPVPYVPVLYLLGCVCVGFYAGVVCGRVPAGYKQGPNRFPRGALVHWANARRENCSNPAAKRSNPDLISSG